MIISFEKELFQAEQDVIADSSSIFWWTVRRLEFPGSRDRTSHHEGTKTRRNTKKAFQGERQIIDFFWQAHTVRIPRPSEINISAFKLHGNPKSEFDQFSFFRSSSCLRAFVVRLFVLRIASCLRGELLAIP
jgi:hypothetical protein